MPSVAIVGFSNKTFDFCKTSTADQLWTMNHAYLVKDLPRIDRLFEIHKEDWYGRKESKKAEEYIEWLRQPHPFPVYMQQLDPRVPSSVQYPLEAIIHNLLPGLKWVDAQGSEILRKKYFTSSAAFMIALAIHECFNPIEIYGVDMEGDTEYGYQRPCFEFWMGLALGCGIDVILQEPCNLCHAPLYGYDVVPYIDDNKVKDLMQIYQKDADKLKEQLDEINRQREKDPTSEKLEDEFTEVSAWYYTVTGAVTAASRLLMESDTYISRQFLELKRANYINGMEYHKGMVNVTNSAYWEKRDRGEPFIEDWQKYLEARASMYLNMGANQLLKKLMELIDFRPVDFKLTMDIIEK